MPTTEHPSSASRVEKCSPPTPSPMTTTSTTTSGIPRFSQAVDGVRTTQHRLGDVAHVDAAGCHSLLASVVRVSVHDEAGADRVVRFGEQVAAEEREDLGLLALHRVLDRRVVHQLDAPV